MLLKMLPGLILASTLGLIFTLSGRWGSEHRERAARRGRIPTSPRLPGMSVFRIGTPEDPRIFTNNAARRSNPDPEKETLFAVATPIATDVSATTAGEDAEQVRESVQLETHVEPYLPFGPSSMSALANLDFAAEENTHFIPTSDYPELPDKGITTWSESRSSSTRQRLRSFEGQSTYNQSDKQYTVGINQDWSIDSVIGVSLDMNEAKVKSRYDADFRTNEITGYVANANYHGTYLGRYPVEAKAFYGWFEHEGSGSFSRPSINMSNPWKEKKHRSTLYGVSAKMGMPLLFLDNLKILPELGVDYRLLTTKAYRASISDNDTIAADIPEMQSKSISIPFTVTMKKDFPQLWGIVTPRLAFGAALQLDESAGGLEAWNSASASRIDIDYDTQETTPIAFDPAHQTVMSVGVGLDVKTVGGWRLSADFERRWAEKYGRDSFKLELGRCF